MKTTFPVLIAALLSSAAFAQPAPVSNPPVAAAARVPIPAARGPALALALEAASTAIKTCSTKDQKIGVAVLDSAGVVKVLLASDGASPRGVSSGNAKALTALRFSASTSLLQTQVKTDQALADKIAADTQLNARAGAVLIKVGDEIIGAIGVGGARGSDIDEACAVAGLQVVQNRLK